MRSVLCGPHAFRREAFTWLLWRMGSREGSVQAPEPFTGPHKLVMVTSQDLTVSGNPDSVAYITLVHARQGKSLSAGSDPGISAVDHQGM